MFYKSILPRSAIKHNHRVPGLSSVLPCPTYRTSPNTPTTATTGGA